jgi:hypothetical protein
MDWPETGMDAKLYDPAVFLADSAKWQAAVKWLASLYHIRIQLVNTAEKAQFVVRELERLGLCSLSEAFQLQLLSGILCDAVRRDNLHLLQALLPKIPTYRVAERSITSDYKWKESHVEVQRTLLENKSRWRGEPCVCRSHSEPSSHAEKLCAMSTLASECLAAELFCANAGRAKCRCVVFLLEACPRLLRVPGGQDSLLLLHPYIGFHCLEKQPMVDLFAHRCVVTTLLNMLEQCENMRSVVDHPPGYRNAIVQHATSYVDGFVRLTGALFKDAYMRYRNENGETALHRIFTKVTAGPERLNCLRILLELGLDPSITDIAGTTVLDRVFLEYKHCLGPNEYSLFKEHTNAILPHFQDPAIRDVVIPDVSRFREVNSKPMPQDILQVWDVILDLDRFPGSTLANMMSLVGQCALTDSVPCELCVPLGKLVLREMLKGLPLVSPPPYVRAPRFASRRAPVHLFRTVCYGFSRRFSNFPRRVLLPGECCQWNLLELMIHSSASLLSLSTKKLIGYLHILNLCFPDPLSNERRVVHLLWLYAPTNRQRILRRLHRYFAMYRNMERMITASELLDLMRSVRPLRTLCRLVIVRQVRQWKLIAQLPLPRKLIRYVQLGDSDLFKLIE